MSNENGAVVGRVAHLTQAHSRHFDYKVLLPHRLCWFRPLSYTTLRNRWPLELIGLPLASGMVVRKDYRY